MSDAQFAPAEHRRRWTIAAVVAAVLLIIGWYWWDHRAAPKKTEPAAIAVETATTASHDVPVYLTGLGNVQAFYTAKITARVDGQLQQVAFVEGQVVKKGQLLAQIDPRPLQAALNQAVGTQAKDSAQLESAQHDLDRYMQLAPQNLTSQQVLDTQRALVAQLQAQLKIDGAAIDNARTQLDYASITSPFEGRTGIRLVDPGNIVHAADTTGIVVLTQVQPISVLFTLPEDSLLAVTEALTAGTVHVEALSRDELTQLDVGTLALVDNQVDTTTGTVRLKATFPNAHNALWPGQFVNVRILLKQLHDVVTLPPSAVQRGPNGLFVYVVKPDSTVDIRMVTTGDDSSGVDVITSGLQPNEMVVTSNQYRLQPGARVRVAAAAKAPTAAPATLGQDESTDVARRAKP